MLYKRQYDSYKEYTKHQAAKLSKAKGWLSRTSDKRVELFEEEFERIFSEIIKIPHQPVLCLAARLGEEVQALKNLGYKNSIGIDLNPGEGNDLVIKADFHNIPFEDNSYGLVYTNSIDHAFDLEIFFNEIKRVLRKEGIFLLGVNDNYGENPKDHLENDGSYESIAWDSLSDVLPESFKNIGYIDLPTIKGLQQGRRVYALINNG